MIKGRYIKEHRLVMAQELGRPITRKEVVHHLNEDKLDNRPENLIVVSATVHRRLHRASKLLMMLANDGVDLALVLRAWGLPIAPDKSALG